MLKPVCPKCSSGFVKRVSRGGFEQLMSVFYIYPFRCQECGRRFRVLQWGVTYTKIEMDRAWGRRVSEKQPRKMKVRGLQAR
jgi:predicted nucleic acid-binding Zn ribbon protein